MADALAVFSDATFGGHHPRGHDRTPIALELTRPEHDVGDARLVLDRDEDRIALARSLADEDDPRGADEAVVPCLVRLGAARHAFAGERGAQESHRMILPRQPRRLVIGAAVFGLRRSEEHTSALQSLMRISYDVFCLKTN